LWIILDNIKILTPCDSHRPASLHHRHTAIHELDDLGSSIYPSGFRE
jgi:hypothetical protein